MNRYHGYLFDLDGTLYRGAEPIPSAVETVRRLYEDGAGIRYLTNNSAAPRQEIARKLTGMGYPCEPEWVECAAQAAVDYCQKQGIAKAFVVGDPGLHSALQDGGVETMEENDPEVVIAGICRSFTYDLMSRAMQAILGGAPFVATNTDASYPKEEGRLEPGAGAIVSSIATCASCEPIVLGKPEPFMVEQALRSLSLEPNEVLVVGDRPETDLEAGRRARCDTWLVLTGVQSEPLEGQPGGKDLSELLK